jgi:hypothetical protein
MSVRVTGGVIILEGACPVDEAEPLLELLLANPGAPVDWSACGHLHTAVVQVLLAARPPMEGEPAPPFLRRWIAPAIHHK